MKQLWAVIISTATLIATCTRAQSTVIRQPSCSTKPASSSTAFDINIRNLTPNNLTLFLLNPDCEPIFFYTLRPASIINQTSFSNFSWVLVENSTTTIVDRFQPLYPSANVWTISPDLLSGSNTAPSTGDNLSPLRGMLASHNQTCSLPRRSGNTFNITIRNLSPSVLTLYWLDSSCNRNFFTNIPGSSYIPQPSAVNDAWIVVDNETSQVVDRFKPLVVSANRWDINYKNSAWSMSLVPVSGSNTPASSNSSVSGHEKLSDSSSILNANSDDLKNKTGTSASLNASGQPMSRAAVAIGTLVVISFAVAMATFFFVRTEKRKSVAPEKHVSSTPDDFPPVSISQSHLLE